MINLFNWSKAALFSSNWEALMLKGVIITVIAVCFIGAPGHTVHFLTWLFGVIVLIGGILALIGSGRIAGQALRGTAMLTGVVMVAAGAFMTIAPDAANFLLVAILAFFTLLSGVNQIMIARHLPMLSGHMWLSGILAVIAGLFMLFLPGAALEIFGVIIGIYLLAFGIFNISMACVLRQKTM